MVSSKSSKQTKKTTGVVKPSLYVTDPCDTPFGKRLLSKNASKAPRRTLYTEPHNKFLPDDLMIPELNNNIQTFKSGRSNRLKPQLSFPTSL